MKKTILSVSVAVLVTAISKHPVHGMEDVSHAHLEPQFAQLMYTGMCIVPLPEEIQNALTTIKPAENSGRRINRKLTVRGQEFVLQGAKNPTGTLELRHFYLTPYNHGYKLVLTYRVSENIYDYYHLKTAQMVCNKAENWEVIGAGKCEPLGKQYSVEKDNCVEKIKILFTASSEVNFNEASYKLWLLKQISLNHQENLENVEDCDAKA